MKGRRKGKGVTTKEKQRLSERSIINKDKLKRGKKSRDDSKRE